MSNLFIFQGLKTGMYYLRTKPAADAIQFTVDKSKAGMLSKAKEEEPKKEDDEDLYLRKLTCSRLNKEDCESCGA